MNKNNIWIDKQCPFYWDKEKAFSNKLMDENHRCLLKQAKSCQAGEPGCVYHGSPPPVCFCRGEYLSTDMVKIGKMLWECPLCKEKMTGKKNHHNYNEYVYLLY